jgi:FkbM family methyltransferase
VTVSVVIASENHASFIAEAMESVLAQTVDDIELVVVDSGSTDRTPAVLSSVIAANPGARIELVSQPPTGHPADARNRGVEVASGELIVCLEPYDMLAPDFVQCCRAELDADPDAGFAYTDQVRFGATSGYDEVPEYDFEELIRENYVGLVALFRREAWVATGGFDALIPYDEWDFWIGCADHGHHGVKASGTVWHHRVRTNGRFRSDGLPEVRRTRAELMRKRPHLYSAGQHAWADVVLAGAAPRTVAATGGATLLVAEPPPAEVTVLPRRSDMNGSRPVREAAPDVRLELFEPGELVLQVGAGDGELTASFVERGARVVAVEPDPRRARALRERLDGADLVVIEKAVGSWEGAHESAWPQPMLVQMTTLARVIEQHGVPVLCTVGPESFADHVLAGLDRPLPCVGFQFSARTLREARLCAWRLAALGMTEFNYTANGGGWASDRWIGTSALYSAFNALEREGAATAAAYARPRAAQPCSSGAIVSPASFNSSQ